MVAEFGREVEEVEREGARVTLHANARRSAPTDRGQKLFDTHALVITAMR